MKDLNIGFSLVPNNLVYLVWALHNRSFGLQHGGIEFFLPDFTTKNLQNILGVKIHHIRGRISLVLMLYSQNC